jgi:hypothetical protein
MPGERFDYTNQRQRHEKFVGREALLARLDGYVRRSSLARMASAAEAGGGSREVM